MNGEQEKDERQWEWFQSWQRILIWGLGHLKHIPHVSSLNAHSHSEHQNTGLLASTFPKFQMSGVTISPPQTEHSSMEKVRDVIHSWNQLISIPADSGEYSAPLMIMCLSSQ
jgi:hypothetical protein